MENGKNKMLDVSGGDFASPIEFKKFKSSSKVANTANKARGRKPMKKRQATLHQIIKENFHYSDVNPEHLQLALALSESSSDEQIKNSEDEFSWSLPINNGKMRTLMEYGFGTVKNKIEVQNKLNKKQVTHKINKKSKFRFITPVLLMRTDDDRQSLIEKKISIILSENTETNLLEHQKASTNVCSEELISINCPSCCLFRSTFRTTENFRVSSLDISENPSKCGFLLKDWKSVPLRDSTPERLNHLSDEIKDEKSKYNIDYTDKEFHEKSGSQVNEISSVKNRSSVVSKLELQNRNKFRDSVVDELEFVKFSNNKYLEDNNNTKSPNLRDRNVTSPDLFDDEPDYPFETTKSSVDHAKARKNLSKLLNFQDTLSVSKYDINNISDKKLIVEDNGNFEITNWSMSQNGVCHYTDVKYDSLFLSNSSDDEHQNKFDTKPENHSYLDGNCPKLGSVFSSPEKKPLGKNTSSDETFIILSSDEEENMYEKRSSVTSYTSKPFQEDKKKYENSFSSNSVYSNIPIPSLIKKAELIGNVEDEKKENVCMLYNIIEPTILIENDENKDDGVVNILPFDCNKKESFQLSKESNQNFCNRDIITTSTEKISSELESDNMCRSMEEESQSFEEIVCISDEELNYSSLITDNNRSAMEGNKLSNAQLDSFDDLNNLKGATQVGSLPFRRSSTISQICSPRNCFGRNKSDSCITPNRKNTSDEERICGNIDEIFDRSSQSFEDFVYISDEELNYSSMIKGDNTSRLIKKQKTTTELKEFNDNPDLYRFPEATQSSNTPFRKFSSFSEIASPKTGRCFGRNKSDSNITPDRNCTIKTKNITPIANYEAFNTPEIIKELDKFGLKPLKRKRGVNLLKHIYEMTHPIVGLQKVDSEMEKQVEKIKPVGNGEETNVRLMVPLAKTISESEAIFERKRSSKIPTCQVPLQLAWHNLLMENPSIWQNVLLFEPLQVEVIHQMLKAEGFKFHIQDLITFFDMKCITIRIAQSQKKLPHKS